MTLRLTIGRTKAIAALALLVGLALAGWHASSATALAPIVSYSAQPSTSQAGGHPDIEVQFTVKNRLAQQSKSACNCEDAKDANVHLPTGFIGNPSATPQCSIADFSTDECPIDSQIGAVEINAGGQPAFLAAVYNLIPPPDVAGMNAFKIFLFNTPQFTILSGRTESDYGLDAKATSIFHGLGLPLEAFRQVLWGVPADHGNDLLRFDRRFIAGEFTNFLGEFCDANGAASTDDPTTIVKPCLAKLPPTLSNSPLTPYLQNPTTCDTPLISSMDLLSYDGTTDHAEQAWPQGTGCSQLSFNPSLYAQPTTNETDSAAGVDVNLTIPQPLSPTIPSPSELKETTVTLPPGFSINPNAADGKVACTEAQANFGTRLAAACPEFAKIGSLEIDSSALPGPLPGFVYLGEPLPGNRYRVFLAADGFATHVKLAGTVTPDPQNGGLTISFKDLPQSPLTAFNMHFFGSERGALATPTRCGTYPVTSTFVPWNSRLAPQTSSQFFTLDSGPDGTPCPEGPRPFSPAFTASSAGNTAGAQTPFAVEVTRPDGNQTLSGLTVKTPPGFAASLRGIPYCPESAIAQLGDSHYAGVLELTAPACPVASQIGTAAAGAGAGSRPLYVSGKVYLSGPYKGAPLSLVVVLPAVSGPYDLGNVAVRAAIQVDPLTAQVTTTSDPLPQILEGIPLRNRLIRVSLDRPNFAINPTNCEPLSVDATITGDEGAVAAATDPFQVSNCASLAYAPRFEMKLSGGLRRRGHPAIKAVLTTQPGEANSRLISVTLPKGELLDNGHIGTVCTRVDFAKDSCPATSRIGTAEVTTPLLDQPLQGAVYLRSSKHELPDIALDLEGQFDIEATGTIDSVGGRLRTTFETVPDAPVSRIVVNLAGGAKGLVQNSESLCGASKRAMVRMVGQSDAMFSSKPKVQTSCRSKSKSRAHVKRARVVR